MMQMEQPQLPVGQPAKPRGYLKQLKKAGKIACLCLFSLIAFLLAFPSLIVGAFVWWIASLLEDSGEFWRWVWTVSLLGAVVYVIWNWLLSPFPWLFSFLLHGNMQGLGLLWLFHLLLAPACASLLGIIYPRLEIAPAFLSEPKSLSPAEAEREEREQERQAILYIEEMNTALRSRQSAQSPAVVHALPSTYEALGVFEGGELSELVYAGNLCLLPDMLETHGVLVGEPKQGKTYTLLQLARIARVYGRKVFFLDLKGSRKTAALFLAVMTSLGIKNVKLFPLEAYDGWRGDPQALYNRLMEQIDPSSHPFYRSGVGATAISLALKAPGGPPRSSMQFLERLDHDWLKAAYATDPQALREIRDIAPHIGGVALVFAGFFRGIAGALDGSWAFDDIEACYIGVDGTANKEEAAALGRYILEDAAHYATSRKPDDERALLIVDEFGVLRSTNATDLFERTREAGLSIYAASQSYHALGRERDHVLAASAIKILHRSGNPEPIIKYAGQRERFTFSRGVGMSGGDDEEALRPMANRPAGEPGLHTVARPNKEYTVPVEDVQQLQVGHAVLISGGKSAYIQVHLLSLPHALVQAATRLLSQAPRFQPAPPPVLVPQPQGQTSQQQAQAQATGSAPQGALSPASPSKSQGKAGSQRKGKNGQQASQDFFQ